MCLIYVLHKCLFLLVWGPPHSLLKSHSSRNENRLLLWSLSLLLLGCFHAETVDNSKHWPFLVYMWVKTNCCEILDTHPPIRIGLKKNWSQILTSCSLWSTRTWYCPHQFIAWSLVAQFEPSIVRLNWSESILAERNLICDVWLLNNVSLHLVRKCTWRSGKCTGCKWVTSAMLATVGYLMVTSGIWQGMLTNTWETTNHSIKSPLQTLSASAKKVNGMVPHKHVDKWALDSATCWIEDKE